MWWKQCLVSLADALGQRKAPNGLAHSQLNTEHIYMHAGKHTHWLCCYQHSWLLDTELFPATECLSINENRMGPPPTLLSGYHSDGTLGWEFGFEFRWRRTNQSGKNTGIEGGHGETFVLVILKDYTWGWRGKKKNVLKWITEREREKNMFLFELRQWPWVTAAGLFGFKCAILRCFVPTGL